MACVVVTTTVGSKVQASALAHDLVTEKLAACVQTMPIASLYTWQGDTVEEEEMLLLIKTTSERYPALEAWIKRHHDDDVPEIVLHRSHRRSA